MVIIGCDFGLRKTGIVILDSEFNIVSQNLIETSTKGAQRLVDVEKAFGHILERGPVDECQLFIEGYAYGAKYQRESLAELGGVIRRYLHLLEFSFWVIPPNTLKLFVTGSGRATKNYMKKCTRENWDISFKFDDVCDAYGLARLGTHTITGKLDNLTQKQKGIVNEIAKNKASYYNANTAKRTKKK